MLRITQTTAEELAILDVQGRLLGPWVDELRSIVELRLAAGPVRLHLEHLSFADAEGIALLHTFRSSGIELVGGSGLIEGLLATRVQQHLR